MEESEIFTKYEGVLRENPELGEYIRKLREQSITDELTGLFNYRHFEDELKKEFESSFRYKHPLSLILADIDDFKDYNDSFGHDKGSELLERIGHDFRRLIRITDTAALIYIGEECGGEKAAFRYGGEEFALLLPGTPIDGAFHVAERFRGYVEKLPAERPVTISLGVATYPGYDIVSPDAIISPDALFKKADNALYYAKAMDKNAVCY